MRKGQKHSPETLEKMRLAKLGKIVSDETRQKLSEIHSGRKKSDEFKQKLSGRMQGNTYGKGKQRQFSKEHRQKLSIAAKKRQPKKGEKNYGWKGSSVGYSALHAWVSREKGSPAYCEHCGTTDSPMFDWANKSGEYLRDLDDWLRLCRSCHTKYDNKGFQAKKIEFNGKSQNLMEWAEEYNLKYTTLFNRLNCYNWSIEKALTTPVKSRGKHNAN